MLGFGHSASENHEMSNTPNGKIHLGIISSDFELRKTLQRERHDTRVAYHGFESIDEFRLEAARRAPISGVLVDIETALRGSQGEKQFLRDLKTRRMPLLEFVTIPGEPAFQSFIEGLWTQRAQDGRQFPRRQRILPSHFTTQEGDRKRCFTFDVSEGGCFLVSTDDFPSGTELRVSLPDLPETVPARIVWTRPWASTRDQLPGFGVQFLASTPETKQSLERLIVEALAGK